MSDIDTKKFVEDYERRLMEDLIKSERPSPNIELTPEQHQRVKRLFLDDPIRKTLQQLMVASEQIKTVLKMPIKKGDL